MSFSEIPPPPEEKPGNDLPVLKCEPPGPQSRSWVTRASAFVAPMGPAPEKRPGSKIERLWSPDTIVYQKAHGSNVVDVDGNRFVDLAAGFGAQLLGHTNSVTTRVLELQSGRLVQALGDVHPSEAKIALCARLAEIVPLESAKTILGQSGADAVTAALKTAALHTGKPGVIGFDGAYHGLEYAPLAVCGLREGYREPFQVQLSSHVRFLPWPGEADDLVLERLRAELARGDIGAVLLEPIQGRAGVRLPPSGFLAQVGELARAAGALVIADEIWTGLGRSGQWFYSESEGLVPDLLCLSKGLGGGLPISACIGSADVMQAWRREPDVVHTSTFAGAPLFCAAAIATIDTLSRQSLVERSREVGSRFAASLQSALSESGWTVRGSGLMVGLDVGDGPKNAGRLQRELLQRGYIVTTGGGARDSIVLTPPLTIDEELLDVFVGALVDASRAI